MTASQPHLTRSPSSRGRRFLPDFANPPVVEVALSVQFEPLTQLTTPHLGLLWAGLKERFPRIEQHPPLQSVIEEFAAPRQRKVEVRLEMLDSPPMPRSWFLNEQGTELIQVQPDRFVHNWRKVGEGDEYPRYEHVRTAFENELNLFREFLDREQVGELLPNQCEVTYVNHIESGAGWDKHSQLGNVITVYSQRYSDTFLPEPEDARLALRYVIPSDDGEPLGRLHIAIDPAFRITDDSPIFLMTLTARGRPQGEGIPGVLRSLDTGREWVVRGFTSITTSEIHKIWGRRDDR